MAAPKRNPVGIFLEQCRRNFHETGALTPSSRALARAMTANVSPGESPRRILEAGPGTGVFTAEIARRMGPFDHLDVYEINQAFADHLEERLRTEPVFVPVAGRVKLHRRNVMEVPPDATYDRIVSSLPLNNFEPDCVAALLTTFMSHLTPGGILSYFEYVLIRTLKGLVAGQAERDRLRQIGEITGEYVRLFQVRSDPVLLNLPPAVARHLVRPSTIKLPARAPSPHLRPAAAVR